MDRWSLWTGGLYGKVVSMNRWSLWTGGLYGQLVYWPQICAPVICKACLTVVAVIALLCALLTWDS